MIRIRTLAFAILAFVIARPCDAQLDVGSVAKPIEIVGAVNHPTLRLDAVANRARVYCFVRLKEDDSLFYLESFDKLADEFALEPAHFFAITNESKDDVEKTVAKENVPTAILLASGDGGQRDYNYFKFPTVVVVDAASKVRFYGMPGDYNELRDAVADAVLSTIAAPELPGSSKAIGKLFEKHQIGEAAKALDKELAKPKLSDADKAKLENARMRADAIAARLRGASLRAEKAEDWPTLVATLTRLDKECAGLAAAADAKSRLDLLENKAKQDPAFAREYAAAVEYAKAERLERDRDWKKAHSAYASIAKLHADTKAGKYASTKADALKSRVK